jgi:hypothetical protein
MLLFRKAFGTMCGAMLVPLLRVQQQWRFLLKNITVHDLRATSACYTALEQKFRSERAQWHSVIVGMFAGGSPNAPAAKQP